jgi:hypothetical protein
MSGGKNDLRFKRKFSVQNNPKLVFETGHLFALCSFLNFSCITFSSRIESKSLGKLRRSYQFRMQEATVSTNLLNEPTLSPQVSKRSGGYVASCLQR